VNSARKQGDNNPDAPKCRQCGTCCKKGGPSFHTEDKPLIEKGIIPARFLYTIRKGETAHDNIGGGLMTMPSDIIKIKGSRGTWTCVFYDHFEKNCKIYSDRPLECRALNCRDTREIEKINSEKRLTRKDLLGSAGGLWELIEDHQQQCDYGKVAACVRMLNNSGKEKGLKDLGKILRYDNDLRVMAIDKGYVKPDMLEFLLGRPITETVSAYGVNVTIEKQFVRVSPVL